MKPLDVDTNLGFQMSTVCTLVGDGVASGVGSRGSEVEVKLEPSSSLSNPYKETAFHNVEAYKDCYTSTFIVLRSRYVKDKVYKDIIMCVLLEYDRPASAEYSHTLMDCLEKDSMTGGAMCLQVLHHHRPCHL
jgi:hypothetical protein